MPVKAPDPSSSSGAFSRQAEGSAGARPGATRVQPAENSRPDGDGARSPPGGLGRSAPRGFNPPTPRHLLFPPPPPVLPCTSRPVAAPAATGIGLGSGCPSAPPPRQSKQPPAAPSRSAFAPVAAPLDVGLSP